MRRVCSLCGPLRSFFKAPTERQGWAVRDTHFRAAYEREARTQRECETHLTSAWSGTLDATRDRMTRPLAVLLLGLCMGCSSGGGATEARDASTGSGGMGGTPSTGGSGGGGTGGAGTGGTGGVPSDASSGSCESDGGAIVVLACGQSRPGTIAVDAANVYWADYGTYPDSGFNGYNRDGAIMKVPIGGGAPIALATAQNAPIALAVRGTNVFWVNCNLSQAPGGGGGRGCAIMKVPVSGGVATVLASDQTDVFNLAVDASSVYWGVDCGTGPSCGAIRAVPSDGGTPRDLGPAGDPVGIAVDSVSVYWTEPAPGLIRKMPLAGGAQTTLAGTAVSGGETWSIAVGGASVYWTIMNSPSPLLTMSSGGGPPAGIACGASSDALALDAKSVYWTRLADGALMSSEGGGSVSGRSTVVAAKQGADHIAVDDTNVYWTTGTEVRKTRKPSGGGKQPNDGGVSCYSAP